jgi:hypothetical protein
MIEGIEDVADLPRVGLVNASARVGRRFDVEMVSRTLPA